MFQARNSSSYNPAPVQAGESTPWLTYNHPGGGHPTAAGSSEYIEKRYDNVPEETTHVKKAGSAKFLQFLGYGLHLTLIGAHIAFAVAKVKGLERKVVIPLGTMTDRLSVILPAATQIVWASYLAVLLLVTQQLALHRVFTARQLLTATHDQLAAWSGIGSALLSLIRQFSLTASFTGVCLIAVYLASAHVLHITAPSLLTLIAAQQTTVTHQGTKVTNGLPKVFPLVVANAAASTYAAAGLLPVLGKSQVLSTPGLLGNILYDIPVDAGAVGLISVGFTIVDVKCGSIPDVKQIGQKNNLAWTIGANHAGSHFMFDLGLNTSQASIYYDVPSLYMGLSLYDNPSHSFSNGSVYWPGAGSMIRPADFQFPVAAPDEVSYTFYGANMVFYSFVNVTDTQNNNASWVPLSPPVPINWKVGSSPIWGSGVQVIGCTLSTSESNGTYDADNKRVLDPPVKKNSAVWDSWSPTLYDVKKLHNLDETLGMIMTGPLRDKSAVPEYLATQINYPLTIYQASYDATSQPRPVSLPRFEAALANATAAILWGAARIGGLGDNQLFSMTQSQAATTMTQPALRLNINEAPLIAGLTASCILLAVFTLLAGLGSGRGSRDLVDGAGLLQILWLFAGSIAQERIAKVPQEKANLQELRKAGLFRTVAAGNGPGTDGGGLRRRLAVLDEDDGEGLSRPADDRGGVGWRLHR